MNMTDEGRQILYRMKVRCSEQWGIALADMELENIPASTPLGAIAWHDAILICHLLRRGFQAPEKYRKRGFPK